MVTSSGRTPKRSVPCSANHVVNVWNVSCTQEASRRRRRACPAPRRAIAAHAAATSDAKGRFGRRAAVDAWLAKPDGEARRDAEHGDRGDQERRPHAEHPAEHQEHDRADAHLERHRAGRERAIARRHEVGDECLERRPLNVDAGVEHDDRADDSGDAERRRRRKEAPCRPTRARTRRARAASRPRPRALARSDTAPAHGTSRSSSTLSIAMTAPMAVRWSPSASRTSGGTKVLRSGPVTPAKSPPRPTINKAPYGGRGNWGGAAITKREC